MIRPRLLSILLGVAPFASSGEVVLREGKVLVDLDLEANQKNPPITQPDPAGDDLILFNNGDLMHGKFAGINEGLIWQRNDIKRDIKFGTKSVKQIIFKSSRRVKFNERSSFITLLSGDRIPGEIVSLDEKNLSIQSPITGKLTLPRKFIRSIAPNPFDGEISYLGPYNSDHWLILEDIEAEDKEKEEKTEDHKEDASQATPSAWIHSGTSFYSQGRSPLILTEANLPDKGRLRFNISWNGRPNFSIALHSDLTRVRPPEIEQENKREEFKEDAEAAPEEEEKEETLPPLIHENLLDLRQGKAFQSIPWVRQNHQSLPSIFGSCYLLKMQSGYPYLSRNFFSEKGKPKSERLSSERSTNSLSQATEAEIEIRFDRQKSLLILYINGVYSNQWNDVLGYVSNGKALGFINHSSTSNIRISEIIISSWAGATDSAKSMEHPDRDVVLLTNGTDRYSGKITHITDGKAHLETNYSEVQIPLSDLSLLNFNKAGLIDLQAEENIERFEMGENALTVIYQPYGLIKLSPITANHKTLTGHSPFLGKISVNLDPALLIRFSDDSPDLSDWFDDF